jgi:hypothetical protein
MTPKPQPPISWRELKVGDRVAFPDGTPMAGPEWTVIAIGEGGVELQRPRTQPLDRGPFFPPAEGAA